MPNSERFLKASGKKNSTLGDDGGDDDNKGASNLITPEKVLSANALVEEGIVISLAAPVPQVAAADCC